MTGSVLFLALAVLFGGLAAAQLLLQKTITLEGLASKEENPKRFWMGTMWYFIGFIGALNLLN